MSKRIQPGNAIVDISSGDMIRARTSVVRLTNTDDTDSVVITKNLYFYMIYLVVIEPAGADGVDERRC